jgi:multicomponent Na+:H+ antiporter subunit B
VTPLEVVLIVFVLSCAVAAALLRDVLAAIIAFGAFSLGVAVIWVFLQAPDVGLTEAAVGAGIMTILFLVTIARTVRPPGDAVIESVDLTALAAALALTAVLATTLGALPAVGTADAPATGGDVTTYYLEHAYEETEVENAVTAVLAAYRGFDTLGEAVVVYAAGVGILVVFGREVFG